MLIYRYEKEDGGGPFFYKDGTERAVVKDGTPLILRQDMLYGCLSLNSLNLYWKDNEKYIQNCYLTIYDVPEEEIFLEKMKQYFQVIILQLKRSKYDKNLKRKTIYSKR